MNRGLDQCGFNLVPGLFSDSELLGFRLKLSALNLAPGYRRLTQRVPEIAAIARSATILDLLTTVGGGNHFLVRSIYFDKTPQSNWLVPWHQDLSIAVQTRIDLPGYGPWTMKEGVPHVQPPREILESIVTVRIHLDDCDGANGAL